MRNLTLHIGHPKTGTTALQSVLSANAEMLLKRASVLYPTHTKPSEYKHAYAIPWLLNSDNESIRRRAHSSGEALKSTSQIYWESILEEASQASPESLILSAEGFWSILRRASEGQILFFRQELYKLAERVEIVAYIKSPASYFLSKINQKLRNFRPVTLPRPDYISTAINGWEQIRFNSYCWRVFDRELLLGGDIVEDFCSQYIPSLETAELARAGIEQANSSVSNEALLILESIVKRYPILGSDVYDKRRYRIVSLLRAADTAIGGCTRPSLTREATESIVRRCADLEWLRKRGLVFPDIESRLINFPQPGRHEPESFTCVSDFCPIDSERLRNLRAATDKKIERLFVATPSKLFFWPLIGRNRD